MKFPCQMQLNTHVVYEENMLNQQLDDNNNNWNLKEIEFNLSLLIMNWGGLFH